MTTSAPPAAVPVSSGNGPAVVNVHSLERPVNPAERSPVMDLDPNDVLPAPGQLAVTLERITSSGQLQSVTDIGQITDAIVFTSPGLPPGKYYCGDGNGLALCMRVLGRKLRCRVLDHAPTKAELRRIRTATHYARKDKAAAQDQLEADIEEEMTETSTTLTEAAVAIGISAGYASKIRSDNKLIPELHHVRENKEICRDARRIIATMPTPELQKSLAEKALAVLAAGGKVKRDLMESMAAELKAKAGTGKKVKRKPMKIAMSGLAITITGDVVESLRAFVERASAALRRLEKDNLPPDVLPSLMRL